MEDTLLTIGDFARRSRLSPKALRLYDRLGLLTPARVDPGTGYRFYRPEQVDRARLIVLLRRIDMPLATVAEVLAAEPGRDGADRVAAYWAGVERRIAVQRELAVFLRVQLSGGRERSPSMYRIERREVPEQTVLSDRQHVRIGELAAWIPSSFRLLEVVAERCGGVAGPPFVIYHGEVSEDSDGPVENCVPVDPGLAGQAGEATVRVEPAHRQLYTRLTRAQLEYPHILGAYEAVHRAAEEAGLEVVGSAREIYFGHYAGPDPHEPVCDVAVPVR